MASQPSHALGARRSLAADLVSPLRPVLFGLRITRRCWKDDLRQQSEQGEVDDALEELIVRDFIRTRREDPDGREGPVAALGVPYMKLKAGRWRGVTIWEARPQGQVGVQDPGLPFPGVVWLAGVGYRKEGDRDDAFEYFERLGSADLAPKLVDYEDLYAAFRLALLAQIRDDLERALNELLEEAWREPNEMHYAQIDFAELGFGVVVFDTIEYRVLVLPTLDSQRRPIPEELHVALIQIAFEDGRLDEVDPADPEMLERLGYVPRPFEYAVAQVRERR